jgi:hypothetical protein
LFFVNKSKQTLPVKAPIKFNYMTTLLEGGGSHMIMPNGVYSKVARDYFEKVEVEKLTSPTP